MTESRQERRDPEALANMMRDVVKQTVPEVMEQTLQRFGFDTRDPIALQEQQEWVRRAVAREKDAETSKDRTWLRQTRERCDKFYDGMTSGFTKALVAGILTIAGLGSLAWIKGKLGL